MIIILTVVLIIICCFYSIKYIFMQNRYSYIPIALDDMYEPTQFEDFELV